MYDRWRVYKIFMKNHLIIRIKIYAEFKLVQDKFGVIGGNRRY